ncbi:hypothetical protein BH09VER1_BH09VER1_48230 [soil metagenome]
MHESLITDVAWTGEAYLAAPVSALIFRFAGLNGTREMKTAERGELEWAQHGGLVGHPPRSAPIPRIVHILLPV